jgi:hypothetical protein
VTGRFAFLLRNSSGTVVLSSASTDQGSALNETFVVGEYRAVCTVPRHLLAPGAYVVTVAVPDDAPGGRVTESALSFEIGQAGSLTKRDGREGVIAPLLNWQVMRTS